jgi:tetratricopeptide (TPR) repeat protein
LGERPGEADSRFELGTLAYNAENWHAAREQFSAALQIARQFENAPGEGPFNGRADAVALAENWLGATAAEESDYERAREHYRTAVKTLRALGLAEYEAYVLHRLGSIELFSGDRRAARDVFQRAAEIEREQGDPCSDVFSQQQLALLHVAAGDPQRSRVQLERVLASPGALNDAAARASTRQRLGEVAWLQGDFDAAREELLAAVDVAHTASKGARWSAPEAGAAAVARHRAGLAWPACTHIVVAERDHSRLGSRDVEAAALHELGTLEREAGNLVASREHLTRALALSCELGDEARQAATQRELANLSQQDDPRAATRREPGEDPRTPG